jgi:peptidyl-prolyl cis-trans isomerase D
VIQIPAKSPAALQQIVQGLAKGQDPAAIAKAVGVEAITYANKPQTAIADRKVGQAAFAMAAGQVAPVQGDLGAAVVKLVSITPGHPVTLEEVKPALEAEIRKDAAAEKVYALTQAYDDAHQAGSNLAQAAQKAGVPALTIGPVSQQGRDSQGQPVQGLSQKLVETAFGLPAGGESEIEDAGNGEYFAVRVEKVLPPAMAPLEEVRPRLIQVFMLRDVAKRLQAKADELAARVKTGESLDAVAASVGAKVVKVANLDRRSASQATQVSQDMLGKVFAAKAGDVFVADNTQFGLVVGKVEAVHPGVGVMQAQIAEQMRPQMSMAIFRELGETAQLAARKKVKVTVDGARARAAIGLEPIDDKADAKKAPAGKQALAK